MLHRHKLIVFVGPDGSGKTTIINKIKDSLSPNNQVQINHIRFNRIPRAGQLKKFILSLFKLKITFIREATVSDVGKPKSQYVYGDNVPMRNVSSVKPKLRPNNDEPNTPEPNVDKDSIDSAVKQALKPKTKQNDAEPGYLDKLTTGLGNMMRNYLDSDR